MDEKIKVVFYGASPNSTYGTSKVINEITKRLANDGRFNIYVVAHDYNGIPTRTPEGVNILPVPYTQRGSDMYVKNIIAYLNSIKPDVFIPFTDAFLLWDEGIHKIDLAQSKVKTIGYFNLDSITTPETANEVHNKCDKIVVSSNFAKEQYVMEGYGTEVILHGTDYDKYHKKTDVRMNMRNHLKLSEKDFVFLSIGRNSPRKNWGALFMAFASICYKYDNMKLLVHMPDHEMLRRNWIDFHNRTIVKYTGGKNPIADGKVIFTKEAGRMGRGAPESFVVDLYSAADVYVSSTNGEGGGALPMMEAMACELPLVIPNNTTAQEFVGDKIDSDIGPRGWLVQVNQPHAIEMSCMHEPVNIAELAKAMEKAYNTPQEIRDAMGMNGRMFVQKHLDWDEKANQFAKIIMEELSKDKAAKSLSAKVIQ